MTYDDQLADSVINDAAEHPRLINGQKKKKKKLAVIDMMMHRINSAVKIDFF